MHYRAGTTCHIALAVISRPPWPHTQAGRRPLLKCHHHFRVQHMGNIRPVNHLRAWPRSVTSDSSSLPTNFLGDAKVRKLVSPRPVRATTAAGGVLQSGHLDIAPHPPRHPANRAESPSRHPTTIALSGVAPISLWPTPYQHALGMTHIVR